MSTWSTIEETPNQKAASIVFTAGGTIVINAPADKVFGVITAFDQYHEWNTWSPKFEFPGGEEVKPGSHGRLLVKMEAQKRDFEIPVEILKLSSTPNGNELAWRGMLMPSWFAVSERVQLVNPLGDQTCEVKNFESMSGWGAHVLSFVLGTPKELETSNLKYMNDLKEYAEREHGPGQ